MIRLLIWPVLALRCATACGGDLCEHPDGIVENERRAAFAGPSLSSVTFNMLSGGPFPSVLGLPGSASVYDATMPERLALQAKELARQHPDVLVLQEVTGTTADRYCSMLDSLIAELDAALGVTGAYNVAFARGDRDALTGRWYSGLAILSRYELRDARIYRFAAQGTFGLEDRIALKVSIHGSEGDVDLVTTHLHSGDPALAAAQLDELVGWLPRVTDPRRTAVLAGDFNLLASSYAMQRLRSAGYLDAWLEAAPDDRGFTFGQPDLRDPTPRASQRIDYVFVSEGTEVRTARLVLNRPTDLGSEDEQRWLWPSDHYGLRVEIVPLGY